MVVKDSVASSSGWIPAGVLERPSELGSVLLRDQFFPVQHRHGRVALQDALTCSPALTRLLGRGLTPEDIAGAAFLDIETTGLSGGEHSFAFLIGIGTFDNLAFRVRQYFLAQPFNEPAMLSAVSNTLERCTCVVTFNGTSFDIPRLSARFALSGLDNPLGRMPHLDLLVPARRLYSHLLDSRRVAEIEQRLLKFHRTGDIPGSEIEARYVAYVRRRSLAGLPILFEHNSLDVRFLAAFLGHLSRKFRVGFQNPQQTLALGRWAEEAGDPDRAAEHYRQTMTSRESAAAGKAAARLARLLGTQRRWQECLDIWQTELLCADLPRRVQALVQLAKLHQIRLKAPDDALSYALEARRLILESSQQRRFVLTLPAIEQRIGSLERKLMA